jgi:hypothetical protein
MSTPFVTSVRARPGTLKLGDDGARTWTIRVQVPEVWDAVRVQVSPTVTIRELKELAMSALMPETHDVGELVMKLNGYEMLDEYAPLADTGAKDGSTFLLTYRRRRPVR